jgi:L-cysteine desulfidase
MLCDGAKLSCAYKVSATAMSAIQFARLAMAGAYCPAGEGIVGRTIEETFENLGILNHRGMQQTDSVVIKLIEKNAGLLG